MNQEKRNPVALTLTIAGYVMLLAGLVIGMYVGTQLAVTTEAGEMMMAAPHPLRWVYGGAIIVFSVVTGLLFLGFGENLKILHRIANR